MDPLLAARLQMGLSLGFHIIFAAIGIGLPLLMVLTERAWLRTGQPHYKELAKRWAKATGLLFAVGAVSGTALSFELALLWPTYMELTGSVVGHIFALEGYAFFIEAIFIGLYLYGWDRLKPTTHWWCGVVIAISGALSGILVLGVNAWMQVPVGFELDEAGRITVSDPIAIFKHPAWFHMALHSTLASFAAISFAVAAVYSWAWLRGRRDAYVRSAIVTAMAVGGIMAVAQPISGDLLAKYVFQTQPAKFAAMEGQFETERYAPLRIGGWPDPQTGETRWAIEIPGGLSFLATHDPSVEVPGLDQFDRNDWPPVEIVHLSFQIMVGIGVVLMALSLWFWLAYWRRGADALDNRWLLRAMVAAGPLGFIAIEAGWIVTEVGRQPWVIQGIMRTKDSVTPAEGVVAMFITFTALYILLGVTVVALLLRLRERQHPLHTPQNLPTSPDTPPASGKDAPS